MERIENSEGQVHENVLQTLIAKYNPYIPLFIILIIVMTCIAWVYIHYLKIPSFETTASIVINDEKKGIGESKMQESLDPLSGNKIIENEIEVLKSMQLMDNVVKKLNLYVQWSVDNKFIKRPIYSQSPLRIEFKNPDSLIEADNILVLFDSKNKKISLDNRLISLNRWYVTPWGIMRLVDANNVQTGNSRFYLTLRKPRHVAEILADKLEVISVGKLSSVINLRLTGNDPKTTEDILNSIIDGYLQSSKDEKNNNANSTVILLDHNINKERFERDSIQSKLQTYRAKNGAIDVSDQGKILLQKVSENSQKLSDLENKLNILNEIQNKLTLSQHQGELSTVGIEDPELSRLIDKLIDLEIQFEKTKSINGEKNPETLTMRDQMLTLRNKISEVVNNQKSQIQSTKDNLHSTIDSYNESLQNLPKQDHDIVEMELALSNSTIRYNELLQKKAETLISKASEMTDAKIIDPAQTSFRPVGLSDKLLYVLAVFVAMFIVIVAVTGKELMNNTILFRDEIERITTFPVIGEIAFKKSKTPLVINDGTLDYIFEQFRLLRTTIFSLSENNTYKKILITSTVPGEGKSFIALNLAMSFAITGKKIVLLEFDLVKPSLSSNFNIEKATGIIEYLSGKAEIKDIVTSTSLNENLFFVSAGTASEKTSELIVEDKIGYLFKYLEKQFDFIIIDSAPVGLLSDGYILSKVCDLTFYVVRQGKTLKTMLKRLDKVNKINKLKNLSLIFNGVQPRGFGKHKYGYGYGYGYTYIEEYKRIKA